MQPQMHIVAGLPGSGKSTLFPVAAFGVDYFNADDRAAHDNSDHNSRPRLVLRTHEGSVIFLAERVPSWIQQALQGTEFDPTGRRK
jgi:predicted ABC-type ATPase